MRNFKVFFVVASLLACPSLVTAQTEIRTEAQLTTSSGSHTPLWLNANKYGLSSLDKTNGYLRAGIFESLASDSLRHWAIAYGVDVAIAKGFTSTIVLQQSYTDIRWLKGLLTIGSKQQPMELKNQELSSGAQTLGINARPIPSIRLSLPEYWTVPYTRGWLGLKGHVAYGIQTDDRWQKDFIGDEEFKRTEHAKIHTKAGYLRIGKEGKPVSVELGLEMACQYGGTTYTINPYPDIPGTAEYIGIKNQDGLKGIYHAFIPGGGETGEGIYDNTSGNHLGSYLLRLNMDYEKWYLGLYADHFFEDHSQMFFLDYDGYGQGDEFNERKDNRWLIYDLKDIMLGVELQLKEQSWLNTIVVEYLYTKYQSGPINHDRTRLVSDHIAGRDGYYTNYMQTGWQHWGQVLGNPLYRSPLYNENHEITVADSRFWAWHIGLSGSPLPRLHYRLLATWQRGWGTYNAPLPDPQRNRSFLAEAEYAFCPKSALRGWAAKIAVGHDHGALLGNNTGIQFTISHHFNIQKQ